MRNFTKYLLTLMMILLSSTVMLAQLRVSSTGGKQVMLPESRAVLYEQTNSSGAGQASQDFEAVYDAYDCQGADDFYVPSGMLWNIQTVTATGSQSLSTNITVANVYIYADAAGFPAVTAMNSLMGLTCTDASSGILTIPIPGGLQLGPGHYWISVQDAADYATYGQWYWTRTTSIFNSGACWRNPGNGFGTGAINWTTMTALGYPNSDFLFRLEGTSGPVPTCDYRIDLLDWYGDSWNGGTLDVLVNNVVVLDNITLASGSGPVSFFFNVPTGGQITTVFTAGSYGYECYYYIYNSIGAQVWYSSGYNTYTNPPDVLPGQLYGYCPQTGAVEGYVFNYDGLAIAGATIMAENGPTTTSGPDGYYILEDINGGSTTFVCTKSGYNPAVDVVSVVATDTVQHDFILTQPNMIVNPLYIEETLNPGEYFTTSLNVLNNGTGPLGWVAEIIYPETDQALAGTTIEGLPASMYTPTNDNTIGGGNGQALGEDGNRDLMLCPEGSLFSIPPVSSNNGYTSTAGLPYFVYQSFSGVSGAISQVTFWAIYTGTPPATPTFLINICEPGSTPGAVVTTLTAAIPAVNTGVMVIGYPTYVFTVEVPATALEAGWVGVQQQTSSPTFYWLNTMAGVGFPAYQVGAGPLPERVALCLGGGGAGSWLTMDYYEGNVPGFGGVDNIPTHLDAAGTSPGEVYTADVVFTSTPFVGEITVPVTMIIMGEELVAPDNLEVVLTNDITGQVSMTWTWAGDEFQFFMVKRDGQIIGTTTNAYFTDILPTYGEYCYTVQAVYDEGQTSPAGPECLEWPNPELFVNPMSLEGWVWVDHQVTVYTTIYNTGIGTLYYEFPDFMVNNTDDTRAYCAASGGCDEYISKVEIGTISNSTACTGYGNYTSQSTEVETGETYEITITNGNPIWTADQCGIWVDWNLNEDFEDDGTITVSGSPGVGPYTANITVPDDAEGGLTRMRIRIVYATAPTPCGTSTYGECEDYTLDVQSGFIVAVEPNSGTIASGESQMIAITYDATGFEVGDYYEELLLNSNDFDEPEVIINNTMHVYMPAQFAGMVFDRDNGEPLNGVLVTAGEFQATTNEEGEYSLYVDQGEYDVTFAKLGYMTATVADTFAVQGVVTPITIGLWDMNYAPGFVHAEVMANDTWCEVTWSLPQGPYEIVMDDGEADDYFIYASAGSMNAVKFTPTGYPATVIGGQIYVGDGDFPGPFIGTMFSIAVFDDDGDNGLPGTMLDSNAVTVNNYGWVSFDWLSATIEDGSFYLAMIQTAAAPFSAPIGVDTDNPTYFRSYSYFQGAPGWVLSPLQDFMIRAWVDGPEGDATTDNANKVWKATPKVPANWQQYGMTASGTLPRILPNYERNDAKYRGVEGMSNRDVTNYRVARYSNFDPNGSPAAGTLSELATTANLYYNDNAFGGLPMGWYAYGVKALYTSGLYSNYTISNIVGHLMDYQVTVNVTLSTGLEPINVEVTLQGLEYPYETYFAVTPGSGTVVFDMVWRGHYDITAYKIGYDVYKISNAFVNNDKVYNIVLSEKKYPPTCLVVDPVSLEATWCEPLRTALEQNFEDPIFPPAGWQSLTDGNSAWARTDDGSSSSWPIPAWDSFYACSNDDAAGSDNDGCCDYLITPAMDLRESDGYALYFNSFYDGAFGQLAFVEYSTDGGATWEVLYQVMPATGWADLELDLATFSGMNGPANIWFAFHSDDAGAFASGWAIDNVLVQVPAPAANYIDFWVFLDSAFEGVTTETNWNYAPLWYGQTYTASVAARYTSGLSSKDYYTFFCEYLFPPDSLEGTAPDDAAILVWDPPLEYWPLMVNASNGPKYSKSENTFIPGTLSDAGAINRKEAGDIMISSNGTRDFGDVLTSFSWTGGGSCWGICDDGTNLWVTNATTSPTSIIEVTYEGEVTGNTLTVSEGQSWIGDMVSDGEFLYGVLVGGSNAIVKVELATGAVVGTITGDFATTSQRGMSADFINSEFYIGGWNSNMIWRTDFEGTTISTFGFGGGISGLSWHPMGGPDFEGSLWISENSPADLVTEVDPNNGYATIQSFTLPGTQTYSGAGGEIKRTGADAGAIWVTNQSSNTVYLVDLEEPLSSDPIPQLPENLLGYNVYRDMAFVAYTPHVPEGEYVPQGYVDENLQPGIYQYSVTAVYDLAPYGYPGETGESMHEGPIDVVVDYCFELEFMETWALGNFDANNWESDGANWSVNGQAGNPAPAAEFTWDPILTDYSVAMESYPMCALGMTEGKIWLDFDLKLDAVQPTGEEMLHVQVWNWDSQAWSTVADYSNVDGSFTWTSEHINIKTQAMDKVFKVRFHATGVNSINILSWFVDNIHIYRACDAPTELTAVANGNQQGIVLNWLEPETDNIDEWIHWDDGVNGGNSIGTNAAVEFDCAARWEPAQLALYDGASVTEIAFFPAEEQCIYSVRVWLGAGAANLVVDQTVANAAIGEWNYVMLTTPVPVDITQELWVGYHVNAQTGYPAGVDDGPAIDGYGNMMNFGGWQTLLQINPDFDFNWNIAAHLVTVAGVSMPLSQGMEANSNVGQTLAMNPSVTGVNQVFTPGNGSRDLTGYNIYRKAGEEAYMLLDYTTETSYVDTDDDLVIGTLYCYMVSAVWASENDLCESAFSNEDCDLWTGIGDNDNAASGSFSLYPNPANDHVFITTTGDLKRVTVYNALGQLVVDEITTGKQYELKTSAYTIGVYMVRVETAAGVTTRTLTIQR